MWNRVFRFLKHPAVVIPICVCLLAGGIFFGVYSATDHTGHDHYIQEQQQVEQTQSQPDAEDDGFRKWREDTRINKKYEPTWDADAIIYNVTDGEYEKRTPAGYVREWTPWGNPNIRCVMQRKTGGIACFPAKEIPDAGI